MATRVKWFAKRLLAQLFHAGQRVGLDLLPRHFYSEIPDVAKLRRTHGWRRPFSMAEIQGAELEPQLEFVKGTMLEFAHAPEVGRVHAAACIRNGEPGFGRIESQFLYAFVRSLKPRRIVQVGCGVSTAICLDAIAAAGLQCTITCIEPFPTAFLLEAHREGLIELVQKGVEELDYAFLDSLGNGDLFFVDSTHTLGPAGEVTRIIIEMLPRLSAGVYVHFHDITFPYDYQGDVLTEALFCWHETSLLLGFLTCNTRFRILASLAMLHFGSREVLGANFPDYSPRLTEDGLTISEGDFPSSIYLQVLS